VTNKISPPRGSPSPEFIGILLLLGLPVASWYILTWYESLIGAARERVEWAAIILFFLIPIVLWASGYLSVPAIEPFGGLKEADGGWPDGIERLSMLRGWVVRLATTLLLAGKVEGEPAWVFARRTRRGLVAIIAAFRFKGGGSADIVKSGRLGDVMTFSAPADTMALWSYSAETAGEWIAVEFKSTRTAFKRDMLRLVPASFELAKKLRLLAAQGLAQPK
jgi:hypothetical protein